MLPRFGRPDVVEAEAGRTAGMQRGVMRSSSSLETVEIAWIAEGVSRWTALTIPSVAACRNLIVGTVVQLGLYRYRGGEQLDPGWLLTKPDPSTTWPATIGGTVDDLLFRGVAYWRILDRDAEGTPTRARWTPVDDVTPRVENTGGAYAIVLGYTVAGVGDVPVGDLVRFDSPIPGVLTTGGPALKAALDIEQRARQFASVELPAGVLRNTTGTELSPAELQEVADDFSERRRTSGVAILQGFEYSRENISPADLQLVDGRNLTSATDVARLFSVPVSMISASPSGNASALLYANLTQQLAVYNMQAVAPHLRTIEATLSDVLPRGQSVAFDVVTFLRADPQAATQNTLELLAANVITVEEARSMLGIPAVTPEPDLTPGRV